MPLRHGVTRCGPQGGLMLKAYRRRAFILLTALALEPNASASLADGTPLAAFSPALKPSETGSSANTPPTKSAGKSPTRAAKKLPANGSELPGEPASLWEVMSRIDNAAEAARLARVSLADSPLFAHTRHALGVLPGFTLPTSEGSGPDGSRLLNGKRHRGPLAPINDWIGRLEAMTGTTVKLHGYSNLTFRQDNVSGGAAAGQSYSDSIYQGQGSRGFYNDTNMDVDATFFHSLHYQTHISNYAYNRPGENRVKLDYRTRNLILDAGDINAHLEGNSLIAFSRYLTGVQMTNVWTSKLKTTVLVSQTKAQPQTRTLAGANTSGPYFIGSGQIVEGSAQVRVDNHLMSPGIDRDYTLDTFTGQLQFNKGLVILSSSTIAITYEALNSGQQQGSIYGFRTSLTPRSNLSFGLTYAAQQAPRSGPPRSITEQQYGTSSPLVPLVLNYYIDTTKPVVVTVDGIPQIQGANFVIDTQHTNQIRMVQAVAPTQIIRIQYYPIGTSSVAGSRTVMGLDGTLLLGRLGKVTMETAFSGLSLTGSNTQGKAAQVSADLTLTKQLHTNVTLKDIGSSFTGIESAGFNRNEKSIDVRTDYTPQKRLHLNLGWQLAKRPSYNSYIAGGQSLLNSIGNDTYNSYNGSLSYEISKNTTLSLNRDNLNTRFIAGGSSNSLSDSLNLHTLLGKVTLEGSLSRNNSSSNTFYNLSTGAASTAQLYNQNSSTFSKRVGLSWDANNWINLRANVSDNNIDSRGNGSSSRSNARDARFDSTFRLKHNITLEYSYELSDNGSANLINPLTGTGATLTGTPATGTPSGGTTGISAGGSTSARSLALMQLQRASLLRDTISPTGTSNGSSSFGLNGSSFGQIGGGGYNYGLGSGGNYGGQIGSSLGSYYGVTSLTGRSGSHHLSVHYSPGAKLDAAIGLDTSATQGSSIYDSNTTGISFRVGWHPSARWDVSANYNIQNTNYTGGLGGSNINSMGLTFDGRPFGKLTSRFSFQMTHNKSLINTNSLAGLTTTTTPTTSATNLTNTSNDISSINLHLDYPLNSRQSVYTELLRSTTAGYFGNTDNDLQFGMEFRLMNPLSFKLYWQIKNLQNKDTTNSSYNYHSSSLQAQFGFTF